MSSLLLPVLNLSILIAILAYFLRTPLKNFVHNRHLNVADELQKARHQLHDAQIKFEEFNAKLKAIDAEATALRQQFRQDAEQTKSRILAEAKKLSATIQSDARASAEALYVELKSHLYNELGVSVLARAEALLRDRLTGDDRVRLRQEFSKQVESVQ